MLAVCCTLAGCWLGDEEVRAARDAAWLDDLVAGTDTGERADSPPSEPLPPSVVEDAPLMPPGLSCAQDYLDGDPPVELARLPASGAAARATSCGLAAPALAVGWTPEAAGCFQASSEGGRAMALFRGCAGRELACVVGGAPSVRRAVSPGDGWLILVEGDDAAAPLDVRVEATHAPAWDADLGADPLVLHDGSSDHGGTALGPVSCASSAGATVLRWVAPSGGTWRFEARSLIGDLVLSLHDACSGAEQACADELGFDPLRGELIERELGVGEVVLLRVAAYRVGGVSLNAGAWTLSVSRR